MTDWRLFGTGPQAEGELIKERLSDADIVRIVRQGGKGLLDRVYEIKQKEEEKKQQETEDEREDRYLDELVKLLPRKKIFKARVLNYDNHLEFDDHTPSMVEIVLEEGHGTIIVDGLRMLEGP